MTGRREVVYCRLSVGRIKTLRVSYHLFMTSRLRIVLLLGAALLLTGCLRSTTTVIVDDSGGGEATVLLALDPVRTAEVAAQTGGIAATQLSDANSAQLCDQFRELVSPPELPATATVTDYDVDGLCGQQIDFTFSDGEQLAEILDQVTGGQAGDLDSFVLERQGDEWVFDAPLTGFTSALQTTAASFPPAVVGSALDNTAVTYDLTLPGTAVEGATNADQVDGGRFVWSVDAANPPERLQARTSIEGGGGLVGLLTRLIVGIAIAGLLALVAVLVTRRGGVGGGSADGAVPAGLVPTNGEVHAVGLDHHALLPPGAGRSSAAAAATPATTAAPPATGDPTRAADPSLLATGEAGADPAGFDAEPAATTPATDDQPADKAETAGETAATATEAATPAAPEPRWDAQRAAWVADHPTEGLLIHDEASGQWRRA